MGSNPQQSRFELRFRLTEAQFCQAHRAYLRHSLLSLKNLFLVTIALMIGTVQAQLFGTADWVLGVFGGIWLAVIGLAAFVYTWVPSRMYRRRGAAEQQVIVDGDGIDWKAGDRHRVIPWSEIARASDLHPDYVYFHPHHGVPDILPKEAFKTDEELQAFDRFVRSQLT